jgi:hypothetical protein
LDIRMNHLWAVLGGAWLVLAVAAAPATAQVRYDKTSGKPWNEQAVEGPDGLVSGWFYNLGPTGLRAELVANEPTALVVRYVFPDSVASGLIEREDVIVGAGGRPFLVPHRNGFSMESFGGHGPVSAFAEALEACQGKKGNGKLALSVRRGGKIKEVSLAIGKNYGTYAATYPANCPKSEKILGELLDYVANHQNKFGVFDSPVGDIFAPLAMLASGEAKYLPAVALAVESQCKLARRYRDRKDGLVNWSYMTAAIIVSEYYLATGDKKVLPDLQLIYDFLAGSQYLDMAQINPASKQSHPASFPTGPQDAHGGWGHAPGFQGYGPIAMITGQGALAYSLLHRCGIEVDQKKHEAAYDFLRRCTGQNGYVWYRDRFRTSDTDWADMGRTGAAGIACILSPYDAPTYQARAMAHAQVIGRYPQSFPDTHACPMMGMAYTALGANVNPQAFRSLMDNNRWWFIMAQCQDGSFYYQPNRTNAGYAKNNRVMASAVVAFIYTIPKQSLVITGKQLPGAATKPTAKAPRR